MVRPSGNTKPRALSAAADPPGLVELAAAVLAGVGGVDQQVRPCPARAAASIRSEPLIRLPAARFEAQPVERLLAQRRFDPLAEVGGNVERRWS